MLSCLQLLFRTVRNLVQSSVWTLGSIPVPQWTPVRQGSSALLCSLPVHSLGTLGCSDTTADNLVLAYNLFCFSFSTGTTQEGPYHQGRDCLKSLSRTNVSAALTIPVVQSCLIKQKTKRMCLSILQLLYGVILCLSKGKYWWGKLVAHDCRKTAAWPLKRW